MDIDLLSKMVYDLILDNDRVALPGVGCFVAEIVPASFSDKGYTINPPYRRLYFRSKPDDGQLLVKLYAKSNGVTEEDARRILTEFLAEMKELLFTRKIIVFPGLGRLRATKENNLFFVADEALDIYPEGLGLEPLSLKTHKETEQELSATINELDGILGVGDAVAEASAEPVAESVAEAPAEPVAEPVAESVAEAPAETVAESVAETPAEPVAESVAEAPAEPVAGPIAEGVPEPVAEPVAAEAVRSETVETRRTSPGKIVLLTVVSIVAVAVVLFGVFVLMVNCFPDALDKLLYTQEELDIINYRL